MPHAGASSPQISSLPGGRAASRTASVPTSPIQSNATCRSFIPSVIEPSFGLGRILYCMFEHAFYTRKGDEARTVLRLPPVAAPFKASVFPLLQRDDMNAAAQKLSSQLARAGVYNVIDTTGAGTCLSVSSCSS